MIINYFIDLIITFTIIIFFVWVVLLVILFIYNLCHFIGLLNTEQDAGINADDNVISKFIFICRFLVYPIYLYLCWITVITSYIYWSWLVIIFFVPHLVFVGFIPIPLKIPILLYAPPYKQLTDRGVIPLINRIAIRLIEYLFTGDINNIYKKNIDDIYNFVYEEIKKIFENFFKIIKFDYENILKKPDPNEYNNTIELENDPDKEISEEIQKSYEEDDEKIKIKNLINEEIAICISNKSKLMSSDLSSSELLTQSQTNRTNYAECYAKTINLYINNQI